MKQLLAATLAITAFGALADDAALIAETKKTALAILIAGDPVVMIDNVDRPLQGDWLCTALTSETFAGRVLGVSHMAHVPT